MASLGQMVAGVAHQLNTPLAFSKSNVQMVRQAITRMHLPMEVVRKLTAMVKQAEGDQVVLKIGQLKASLGKLEAGNIDLAVLDQMLNDVLVGVGQMTELVVNLRDFTRLDRANTADADLNKSLHTVVYIARSVISNSIRINESYGQLPPVECNPSQLNQVFLNLINNAAQAIDGTGVINVRSLVDGDSVRIQVEDDGYGIPDEVLPHIFDLYYTTKPPGEGTGLGLAISRDIVRQHGGDITVETTPGTGTTFTVTLPIKQTPVDA
jgi:signal transduction histidine kinase